MKVPDNKFSVLGCSKSHSRSFILNKKELQEMWAYNSQVAGAEANRREVIRQVFKTGKPQIYEGNNGDAPTKFAVTPVWNENGELDSVAVFETSASAFDCQIKANSVSSDMSERSSLEKLYTLIAHDLRSPFTSIMGLSELLKKHACKMKPNEIGQFAMLINNTASKSLQLLDNLLEWASMQQRILKPDKSLLHIYETVEDTIGFFRASADNKNLNLFNQVPQAATVFGDENMVRAILRNLISNAIKFSKNEGEIVISKTSKSGFTIISVRDSGVGIEAGRLKTLFRGKTNETTSGTSKEQGIGFGLVLCRDYTELQGGKIWAESKMGEGSVFSFSLPDIERTGVSY